MKSMPLKRETVWLGISLLGVGLVFHLLAAGADGGTFAAFRGHVIGFLLLTLVSVVAIVFIGRRYWRGRVDMWVLTLGAVQAVAGALIYILRFHV